MKTSIMLDQPTKERYPCIWMQAGVVVQKLCKANYQCISCRFDRAMRQASEENMRSKEKGRRVEGRRGDIISWKEKLKALPPSKRPCLHHMKGRIEFRACTHNYRCGNCDFDQYFHDDFAVHTVVKPVNVLNIAGFTIPQGYYLHPGHTWIKMEEDASVRVGIDEFALRLFGPLESIEAPLMGKELRQDKADIKVTRGVHQASFLSPVSGVVTAINPRVREKGSLANKDPYSEGWVMSVHASNLRQDLKRLMINNETGDFISEEVDRLYQLIEEVSGPLTVDGGYLGNDIYGHIPKLDWKRLTRTFLST